MAFSRHGKEVKRTRFFTPAVCEFFAIVSSLSLLFSRLCILAVGEDRFPSGWCPGSIYENKCGKEIVYIAYMLWRSAEEIHISGRAKRPENARISSEDREQRVRRGVVLGAVYRERVVDW